MLTGTFQVASSDDPRFVVGEQYPLNIDSTVTLDEVTTTTITATASTGDTVTPGTTVTPTDATPTTPTDAAGNPGASAADDEVDTGPAPGEQLAVESTPPATA